MSKLQIWIHAARLRTLPLSLSGILVGTAIAARQDYFHPVIFGLALMTTLGLQILSNFANDYGDFLKGTDNDDRIGPKRAMQSGNISKKEMFRAIIITTGLTFIVALTLIYFSFGSENLKFALLFFIIGLGAIAAAIKYTVGDSAYGYKGLGDVFVFLFFGLVGVYGCYFLYTMYWDFKVLLPAASIGLLSTGVLNLNNMRDIRGDKKARKFTLVVKMGLQNSKKYHYFLLLAALACMLIFTWFTYSGILDLLYLLALGPLAIHLKNVISNKDPKFLDPELKKLALSTFLLAVLFSLGQII